MNVYVKVDVKASFLVRKRFPEFRCGTRGEFGGKTGNDGDDFLPLVPGIPPQIVITGGLREGRLIIGSLVCLHLEPKINCAIGFFMMVT